MNNSKRQIKVKKAYKNADFLRGRDARSLRILAEYLEPESRFEKKKIEDTIVFFGSARVIDRQSAQENLEKWEVHCKKGNGPECKQKLKEARIQLEMSRYYEDARELARLLTTWSKGLKNSKHRFIICSGGGPGIMEAANRGASEVQNGKSIGLNISIPNEQTSNPYITPGLNFEFHYFFMRKFWFIYLAKALVVFPGGFGTMDELFEVLTLIQTKKLQKKMPVILFGKSYWNNIMNFDYMLEHMVIDEQELALFKIVDSTREAFLYLKEKLSEIFSEEPGHSHKAS